MKKFILIFTLVFTFFITNINVNAETITYYYKSSGYMKYISNQGWIYANLDSFYEENNKFSQNNLDDLYDYAIDYYNEYSNEYPYYRMAVYPFSNGGDFTLYLALYLSDKQLTYQSIYSCSKFAFFTFDGNEYDIDDGSSYCKPHSFGFDDIFNAKSSFTSEGPYFNPLAHYSSNYNLIYDVDGSVNVSNYQNKTLTFNNGDIIPTYYDSFISSKYTEVNLDNYEYVILNLKDYNKKAFETNLKVKGMIGITPVYEFGTIEKNKITDRCNISYDDFTNYRFFVLENDLLNNAVYVVRKCQNNSGFKFDSTIFDITYVTAENVDDPVITFGGKDYHTIPFKQLSNTANKNEEENFVPGANEEFKPFDDITNYISSFWDSLTTFMSLVTKFFNTLPIEIRAIAITTFMTGCALGLIKIIKS